MLSATSSASGTPITYTAPASVPNPATVTLTATSAADTSKSDSATITVSASPPPPPPPSPGTPTLIQHVLGPTAGASISSYKLQLPNASLPGNCLIVGVTTSGTNPTITVADNMGNAYTTGPSVVGNQKVALFYALNAKAGVTTITISLSAATQDVQASASEFNNIATAAADGSCTQGSGSGTTVNCMASIPTTVTGDLIYQIAWQDGPGGCCGVTTTVAQATGFTQLHADGNSSSIGAAMAQYQVQAAAGAVNPTLTKNDTFPFDTVAIALKSAASGTPKPPGIHVDRALHWTINGGVGSPITEQFPCSGNLLIGAWIGVDQIDLSGASDNKANIWSFAGPSFPPGGISGSGHLRIAYAASPVTGNDFKLTLTFTGTNTSGDTLVFYDVSGAAASPFDSVAGNPTAQGTDNNTTNPHSVQTVTITPSTANGLIVAAMGVTTNTVVGVSPGLLNSCVTSPEASSGDMDENNGWANEYNANMASRTYSFTIRTDNNPAVGAQGWAAMAAAFKAAP